eukprot:CAMPEP_0172330074 /NCGR_PEP_ID=MMETSP1058-20130122/61213_1 /TAXON_ID=83371 /ORGANISM="Detonula confervacea, Strain CCMP 353" /LENGTH=320 /DNA_ID=CAMNT_0013047275 /DNA_START=83 /DNA_END=1045 /DNA_ORIENTATION=+
MAVARYIPDSFVNAVVAHSADQEADVSLALARKQHHDYLSHLRRHVPTICLPPIESHPDCLFVEDAVVAIGDTAVINLMGHASRRGEVDSIKDALRQLGMINVYDMRGDDGNGDGALCDGGDVMYTGRHLFVGMSDRTNNDGKNVYDMREDDENGDGALCDGGDVMYTGRHLFVGMSDRTNNDGFQFLRNAFASHGMDAENIISVPPVVAGKEVLHLKSAVTHIDEQTLLAPEGRVGDSVLEAMKATEKGYNAIRLPDILSCNVVVVNGHVLAQKSPCEVSKRRIEQTCRERNLGLTFVDTSELAKKDGALTCCSVLLSV